jgi:GNAT superfamily N-acetyltransferase
MKLCYRDLEPEEITAETFACFDRRQDVTYCLRREAGAWVEKLAPFVDQWSPEEYVRLVGCLRHTAQAGGLVMGCFCNEKLKGFVSVEPEPFGTQGQYLDLSALHVSRELRGQGAGRELFLRAARWARLQGARKLYISSHSAVETQAFYRAMGCVDAREIHQGHVQQEPFDRQLECEL